MTDEALKDCRELRGAAPQPPGERDALTGLLNRAAFLESAEALHRIAEASGSSIAILLVDLDSFKAFNAAHGRKKGDLALVEAAAALREILRGEDLLGRVGGDEFAALLPATTDGAGLVVAQRIVDCLRATFPVGHRHGGLAGSVGVARLPADATTIGEALRCAEVAAYEARHLGLGAASFSNRSEPRRTARARSEATSALANGELRLHYQPIVGPSDGGGVEIVEALLRWQHPSRGLLVAGAFLPDFEQAGVIADIDRWTLGAAARQWRSWVDAGTDVAIAVNASAAALQHPHFLGWVERALGENGMPPGALVVEITETAAFSDEVAATRVLFGLANRGVRLALDDFGTGYSSLAYVRRFPVNLVKVDRSFVHQAHVDARDGRIVAALAHLAHALDLDVLAEGVEDAAAIGWLAEAGYDLVQGWGVGRPMPPAQAADWIATWRRAAWVPPAGLQFG